MYSMARKIAKAKGQLKSADQDKVEFIRKAYSDFISESAKMDDELNFIGHPEECKRDWLIEAIEYEILTESEFERLFGLMEIAGMEDAMASA